MKKRFVTPVLLATAALALAGCSGGSESDGSTADEEQQVTTEEYAAGELNAKITAARDYIQENLNGTCPALTPVEDRAAHGEETTTCKTSYGSIILMSSSSPDETRSYLLDMMPSNLDAWDDQGVFFVASPELLDMINQ